MEKPTVIHWLQKKRQKQKHKENDEPEKLHEILRAHFHTAFANKKEQQDILAKNEIETDEAKISLANSMSESSLVVETTVQESVPLHEVNELVSAPVGEANEKINAFISVNQNRMIDASNSIYEIHEEGICLEEAEGPGVTKNEYLHNSGWQNVNNPMHMHELEYVKNEMQNFHSDQEHLAHRQCIRFVKKHGQHDKTWQQKHIFATEVRGIRKCQKNLVLRTTWIQILFLNN